MIRNLHHERPDYYLHEGWEHLPLGCPKVFEADARRWLLEKSKLRKWSLDNADWGEVYQHFVSEADKQIEAHNEESERQPGEDMAMYLCRVAVMAGKMRRENGMIDNKWAKYGACGKCGVGPGEQCVDMRKGKPVKVAHAGRPVVGAELPADTPTPEPAHTARAEDHKSFEVPMQYGGRDTFLASCLCGKWKGANWTRREDAKKEHERVHLAKVLVSA